MPINYVIPFGEELFNLQPLEETKEIQENSPIPESSTEPEYSNNILENACDILGIV